MSSAPSGWDERSWRDVCAAREAAQTLLVALRDVEAQEEPSADRVHDLWRDLAHVSDQAVMAAGWCRA